MSTFTITSSKVNKTFTLENENINIQGSFVTDESTGYLQTMQGTCYRPDHESSYIGNFNGAMRNGEMRYSLSEMSRTDSRIVWDAIDEIESNILPSNE